MTCSTRKWATVPSTTCSTIESWSIPPDTAYLRVTKRCASNENEPEVWILMTDACLYRATVSSQIYALACWVCIFSPIIRFSRQPGCAAYMLGAFTNSSRPRRQSRTWWKNGCKTEQTRYKHSNTLTSPLVCTITSHVPISWSSFLVVCAKRLKMRVVLPSHMPYAAPCQKSPCSSPRRKREP